MKKVSAILTADIHIRETQPVCRTDNFFESQANKIKWLADLQQEHSCPVIDAGDLMHSWKNTPFLLAWLIQNMPKDMRTVEGNHDLPGHNLDMFHRSSLAVLEAADTLQVLDRDPYARQFVDPHSNVCQLHPFPWRVAPAPLDKGEVREGTDRNIAVCHIMTYKGRLPWPGCKAPGAKGLLEKMTGYDLVLTGDNHKPFVIEEEGRLLVNPGSLTRQTADQADHRPRVYLWYAEDNTVEPAYAPIEKKAISRDHVEAGRGKEERLDAFVSHLKGDWEVGLSFEKNLENYFAENKTEKAVADAVWAAVNG